MGIHYIEDSELQKIVEAIKESRKMEAEETFSGADMAKLIRDNKLLKAILYGYSGYPDWGMREITAEDLEGLTYMRSYTFFSVYWLKKITFPESLVDMSNNNFASCTNLEEVVLPTGLSDTGTGGFSGCSKLKKINVENLLYIGSYGMQNCKVLEKLDFHKLKQLADRSFNGCEKLSTVIIRADAICKMANINAFTGTPIASGTGFVYVPKSLKSDYEKATNWTTYADQIRAIEDYPEICGGVTE